MRTKTLTLVAAISTVVLAGAALTALGDGHRSPRAAASAVRVQYGSASWYGGAFHGRRTAYGERFDRNKLTLASRHLPYNTRVRVTCLRTGRSTVARVTDYGPNGRCRHRIADLSEATAAAIGLKSAGVGQVRIEVLGKPTPDKQRPSKPVRVAPKKPQPALAQTPGKAKPTNDEAKDVAPVEPALVEKPSAIEQNAEMKDGKLPMRE